MSFASLDEFEAYFHSEDICSNYLYQLKWPHGFRCSCCGNTKAYSIMTRRLPLYECSRCKHHHSLTTGTVMEKSRTTLRRWFAAIYLLSRSGSSINAYSLSQLIQVTYKTAWLMLHKLRDALDQPDHHTLLDGVVRVQGGAYGNPFNPYTEKDARRHPLLAAGSLVDFNNVTELRLTIMDTEHINHNGHIRQTGEQLFIARNVSPNAANVQSVRYRLHMSRCRPLVRCIAEFNNWASSSFHGLGRKYLQAYANEFSFRYNMQQHPHMGLARLFHLCTHVKTTVTSRSLLAKYQLPRAS
ncbi:transposase [Paenibacillus kobensis]|uniref:transposase n=1 Tax=Paenibacillus kobensis TaxID=59841 RepID=UPI000FD7F890|nr:transposase [Paenibacillus kobensis]